MAEWSKALVLGTSLFGGVGSNPTSVTILHRSGGLAQSVECVVRNDEAPGSKPGFSMVIFCYQPIPHSLVGYDDRLTRGRSPVRFRVAVLFRFRIGIDFFKIIFANE